VCVALLIQHEERVRSIIVVYVLSGSTISHKRHDFRKKVPEYKIYILIFSITFVWNISHCTKNSARYYHKFYKDFYVKYPLLLSHFSETWIFWIYFGNMLSFRILWKSVQWEPSCSLQTDGRTYRQADRQKDRQTNNSRFSNFANALNVWQREGGIHYLKMNGFPLNFFMQHMRYLA
jgi:hypothetical protein